MSDGLQHEENDGGSPARSASRIREIHAREILDSRGLPTVEVDVVLESGRVGRASVPTGASTGQHEAAELRDGDRRRYGGLGVQRALRSVTHVIAPLLVFKDVRDQTEIDEALGELDGTARKQELGANAILAVSLAVARASALVRRHPLYRALGDPHAALLPMPLFNVLNGGAHGDNLLDIEEVMIVPVGAGSFREALRIGAEIYQALKATLRRHGLGTAVGDEGGFAPDFASNLAPIELLLEAIVHAGFQPGRDVVLALDVAASTLFDGDVYRFRRAESRRYAVEQLVGLYEEWVRQFPIVSIEDGLAENDRAGWRYLTERLGKRVQIVGDDVFVTNEGLLRAASTPGSPMPSSSR